MNNLGSLLHPKSIAVIGGGSWCENVIEQCKKIDFQGSIWAVHPKRNEINGIPCFKTVEDLPYGPDASFVGVNRFTTIEVIKSLNSMEFNRIPYLFFFNFSKKNLAMNCKYVSNS